MDLVWGHATLPAASFLLLPPWQTKNRVVKSPSPLICSKIPLATGDKASFFLLESVLSKGAPSWRWEGMIPAAAQVKLHFMTFQTEFQVFGPAAKCFGKAARGILKPWSAQLKTDRLSISKLWVLLLLKGTPSPQMLRPTKESTLQANLFATLFRCPNSWLCKKLWSQSPFGLVVFCAKDCKISCCSHTGRVAALLLEFLSLSLHIGSSNKEGQCLFFSNLLKTSLCLAGFWGFAPKAARSSTPCPLAVEVLWHIEAAFLAAMLFLRNNPAISFLKALAGGSLSGGETAGLLLSILQNGESRKVSEKFLSKNI